MRKTVPVLFVFLVMGIADAMGPMSEAVRNQYHLSNVMATLLSFFVFIAFAVFSVPGGLLATRIGKKNLLLLGLGLNAAGMLLPSLMLPGFAVLLACIFVLGVGTTFLQVAGNPIMRDVSPAGAYSRNLSFAQGFKGIGSASSAYLVSAVTALGLFTSMGWRGSFPIFFILMVGALVMVATLKIEETKADVPPSIGGSLALLKEPVFALAVLGIFLYVGAEVCMGRFLNRTLASSFGLPADKAALYGPTAFFALLTVGRLVGGVVLTVMSPRNFFRLSALLGLLGGLALMTGLKPLAFAGVALAGLGFANIWPMLFSITVEEKPDRANELSGLMCMAISGGAIVPLVMGQLRNSLATHVGDQLVLPPWAEAFSFIVPAACFAYLLVLSLRGGRKVAAA